MPPATVQFPILRMPFSQLDSTITSAMAISLSWRLLHRDSNAKNCIRCSWLRWCWWCHYPRVTGPQRRIRLCRPRHLASAPQLIVCRLRYGVALDAVIFLSNRLQAVQIAGRQSTRSTLTCGVPQGSVLGPIMFTLYTADVIRIARTHLASKFTATQMTCNSMYVADLKNVKFQAISL